MVNDAWSGWRVLQQFQGYGQVTSTLRVGVLGGMQMEQDRDVPVGLG